MADLAGSLRAERVKERGEGGFVATRSCPDESATVVVNNDGQMLVASLVGDLISPDPPEVGELVIDLLRVIPDSGDDRPDGAPRDPHQTRGGPLSLGGTSPDIAGSKLPRPQLCQGVAVVPTDVPLYWRP